MKATHNSDTDEIHEEITQMRIELGSVLKHGTGGAKKVNAVNYLNKQPQPEDEYYYEEDTYVVTDQTGGPDQTLKEPIKRIGIKVNEIKVGTMIITIERDNMFEMGTTIITKTSTGVTMVREMMGVGPTFHLKIVKLLLWMAEAVWCELRICCRR